MVVALLREHAETMRPPRSLWVPFDLGRPFGSPGDVALQTATLRAALRLFDRESGPVLDDFDAAGFELDDEDDTWVCPVSFAAPGGGEVTLSQRLGQEIEQLRPWYELARERRGRTTVGLIPASIDERADWLAACAEALAEKGLAGQSMVDSLRWASLDLRAYYFEAACAQPGATKGTALESWFWRDTSAGELLQALRQRCLAAADPDLQRVGEFMLVPDAYT